MLLALKKERREYFINSQERNIIKTLSLFNGKIHMRFNQPGLLHFITYTDNGANGFLCVYFKVKAFQLGCINYKRNFLIITLT